MGFGRTICGKAMRFRLAFLVVLAGCGVHSHGQPFGVFQAPPPPHVEVIEVSPGYIWVNGHWDWDEGAWRWQGGRQEPERPGEVWVQGRWEKRGKGAWFWVDGRWYGR